MIQPSRNLRAPERRWAAAGIVAATIAGFSAPARGDDDPWFGRDKALHFGVSAAIAGSVYAIAATQVDSRAAALAWGAGVSLAIGAAKEGADALGLGDPSWRDLTWDAIGTAAGLLVAWSVDLLVRGVGDPRPLLAAPSAMGPRAVVIHF
jgi:putative lipoprotein